MIELNLAKPHEVVESGLKVVENDSGLNIELKIFDGETEKDLTGYEVRIRFRSLNGFVCDEQAVVSDGSTVTYSLLGTEFQCGQVLGIVSLYDSFGRISTCKFGLECIDGLNSDSSVRASKYYSELEKLKNANTIEDVKIEEGHVIILYADGRKFDAGNVAIENSVGPIYTVDTMNTLKTNKIYQITTSLAQIVAFDMDVDTTTHNQILIYLKLEQPVGIYWDENIVFVDGEEPNMSVGAYRIIAEFNPVIGKWVVGVIQDGEAM